MKETSGTGFLRSVSEPARRFQDGIKLHLLCRDCENLFGRWENEFSSRIFRPLLQKSPTSIAYNDWFLHFAVSVCWRSGVCYLDKVAASGETINSEWLASLEDWRLYLRSQKGLDPKYQFHAWVPMVEGTDTEDGFFYASQVYRSLAADVSESELPRGCLVSAKLPWMLIVGNLTDYDFGSWRDTRITPNGNFAMDQEIGDEEFLAYWDGLIRLALRQRGAAGANSHAAAAKSYVARMQDQFPGFSKDVIREAVLIAQQRHTTYANTPAKIVGHSVITAPLPQTRKVF